MVAIPPVLSKSARLVWNVDKSSKSLAFNSVISFTSTATVVAEFRVFRSAAVTSFAASALFMAIVQAFVSVPEPVLCRVVRALILEELSIVAVTVPPVSFAIDLASVTLTPNPEFTVTF